MGTHPIFESDFDCLTVFLQYLMSGVEFIVESIVDFREYDSDQDACIEYKVKWKGFSDKQCTWEPHDSLCEDRGTRKKIHEFDKNYMERIAYKIRKYSQKGFSGLEKVREYKRMLRWREKCLNGRHIEKQEAKRRKMEEEEEEEEPKIEGVIIETSAGISAQEEREYNEYLEKQEYERKIQEAKQKEKKLREKRERERQAVPKAFLDKNAPDVRKVKLDRRKNGELKDYERLVFEKEKTNLYKLPNVLHEF